MLALCIIEKEMCFGLWYRGNYAQ